AQKSASLAELQGHAAEPKPVILIELSRELGIDLPARFDKCAGVEADLGCFHQDPYVVLEMDLLTPTVVERDGTIQNEVAQACPATKKCQSENHGRRTPPVTWFALVAAAHPSLLAPSVVCRTLRSAAALQHHRRRPLQRVVRRRASSRLAL